MPPVTDDPNDPRLGRGHDDAPVRQSDAYLVLSDEERARGFVRPFRDGYRHHTNAATGIICGAITTMGRPIAETYARDPHFYGSTYCTTCQMHRPLGEFTWMDGSRDTAEKVGS